MDPFETKLRQIVTELSYKDWVFRVEKDGIGLWFLQVQANALCATMGTPITWGSRKWRVSMHMTTSELVSTALKAVLTAEEHEAREQFLWRGRAIFGPHMNVETLWQLVGDPAAKETRHAV